MRVRVVFRAVSVPFVLLMFANMLRCTEQLYLPYAVALALATAFSLWNHRLLFGKPFAGVGARLLAGVGLGTASGVLVVLVPWVAWTAAGPGPGVAGAAIVAAFSALNAGLARTAPPELWCARYVLLSWAAAGVALLLP